MVREQVLCLSDTMRRAYDGFVIDTADKTTMAHTYIWQVNHLESSDVEMLQNEIGLIVVTDEDQTIDEIYQTGTAECCTSDNKFLFYQFDKALTQNQVKLIEQCMSSM